MRRREGLYGECGTVSGSGRVIGPAGGEAFQHGPASEEKTGERQSKCVG